MEAKRVLLEQEFTFVVPSPNPQNTQRFVSGPVFEGVDPPVIVRFVADYAAEGPPPRPAGQPAKGGLLGRLAEAFKVDVLARHARAPGRQRCHRGHVGSRSGRKHDGNATVHHSRERADKADRSDSTCWCRTGTDYCRHYADTDCERRRSSCRRATEPVKRPSLAS